MQAIRTSDPRELLSLIPYQLGFQPKDSMVTVSLRGARSLVGLLARVDLPDVQPEAARALIGHLRADGASSLAVVFYTDDDDAANAAQALVEEAASAGHVDVVQAWVVTETVFYPLGHPEVSTPVEGLRGSAVAAAMTFKGVAPAADRASLGLIGKAYPRARAAATRARNGTESTPDRVLDMLGAALTASAAGTLAKALRDQALRDAALLLMIGPDDVTARALANREPRSETLVAPAMTTVLQPGGVQPDPDQVDGYVERLTAVVAHATAKADTVAPLTLLAFLAWWSGDGAMAAVHLERALAVDQGYTLALLVKGALDRAMPPGWLR